MNVWKLTILAAPVVALPTEHMNKRQIPYGGIIAFGNSPGTIQALQPKQPCPDKSGKPRGSPLLGLVDIALDVHSFGYWGMSDSRLARERMAISELVNSEAEAVEALDRLRSHESRGQFMQHVQAIPLVSSALEMYGRSRQSSALVRVGGDVIESGVRRMCEPIAKRIDMGPLDDFACRQLSNLGYSDRKRTKAEADSEDRFDDRVVNRGEDRYDGLSRTDDRDYQDKSYQDRAEDRSYQNRAASNDEINHRGRAIDNAGAEDSRRGWGVGSLVATARERAVAYREDSMRRLKYCLDWVVYATALLHQYMGELGRVLDGLHAGRHEPAAASWVGRARRDVVDTVRRAVGVVSQYAGAVLPGEARRHVRSLILGLPGRWATVEGGAPSSSGSVSEVSPMTSPRSRAADDTTPAHIQATARRTLAFATESFYMLDSVRNVFSNLHANAERWIGAPKHDTEPIAAPMYREPVATTSARAVRQPLRRRMPSVDEGVCAESGMALVEIGEQMRRMDVRLPSRHSFVEDDASCKRNRTREPTPTRM
ncbi:transcriptional regulator opi1 [Coemansia sp. RSA 2131]|nr:transcriptional regulator opi1 [Coemansia sp. RSA 2131]